MQLAEAKIEQLLCEHIQMPRNAIEEMDYQEGVKDAAHAIAEKMREGVVAKIHGRWTTDDLGYHVLTVDSHSNWEGQKIRMATVMQGQLENYYGQRVTVTVRKEEGDG